MGYFFLGLGVGGLLGFMIMALCVVRKSDEEEIYTKINHIRKIAVDTEKKANATDDPLKKATAEGMWEAVRILYGD